jgi:cytochrome c biogenesis protein CcmG/thiol:disulfide interchange protein DsbE
MAWRVAVLGAVILMVGFIAFVTLRTNRPAAIAVALARGEAPPAPDFTLPRLDAEGTLSLASLRGQVVVLNFWASWCVPCRDEAPAVEATWQRYKDKGVVVVGVNVQDLTPSALRFLEETRATFPNVRSADGAVYRAYGLTGVPETFFVTRDGRILKKFPGVVTDPAKWFAAVEDTLRR